MVFAPLCRTCRFFAIIATWADLSGFQNLTGLCHRYHFCLLLAPELAHVQIVIHAVRR